MSAQGYNGFDMTIEIASSVIAGINAKTIQMGRQGVEVPTDGSEGWMVILPTPGRRNVDCPVEGVVTSDNVAVLVDQWVGDVNATATIKLPDGRTMTAAHGFFMQDLEYSGPEDGHIAFSCTLRSSGKVTVAAASG